MDDALACVATAPSSGIQKLGQPVPLSNFESDENSGSPQPAHAKVPRRRSASNGLVNGGSVAPRRNTRYCCGDKHRRQCVRVYSTSNGASRPESVLASAPRHGATPPASVAAIAPRKLRFVRLMIFIV